ncbi:MAG: hypothetical protein ACO1RA_07785 [Planctomycetaceae bacterium]
MPRLSKALRHAGAVVGLLASSTWIFAADPEAAPEQQKSLPLSRVVLFSSSVGFFEHSGEVEGNRQLEFSFKTSDINDLLKSMVVQDKDGGTVSSVNYGSPEPLERTLRTFTVNLADGPTLAEIFQQLRGQEVELEATDVVKGKVIGVERRNMPTGNKEVTQVEVVNLRTDNGVRSLRIDSLVRTKIMDPKVDQEFQQALMLIAGASSSDKKQVKLDFHGKGKRKVSVGYIQESPVWKTSYRLVLQDDKPAMLQGWAIVENTTAQDWKNVELSLVSGRPISFQMDLYQPMFITRPFARLMQHAQLTARTYSQDMSAKEEGYLSAMDSVEEESLASGMGGGMGGMGGGGGILMGRMAGESKTALLAAYGGKASGYDLSQGVKAVSDASEVGEFFRYAIKEPVTLPRSESAMLPIVNHEVKVEKVAIFNASVHQQHPLSGLKLTNTTDLHWLQGPITLFDGGEYAGDAQIADIPPKESRLISYALDLETEVKSTVADPTRELLSMTIQKGGMQLTHRISRKTTFTIKNSGNKAKQMLVEIPLSEPWKVASPKPAEVARDVNRFAIEAPAGKTVNLVIEEQMPEVQEVLIANLDLPAIEVYLKEPSASPEVQKYLKDLLAKRTNLANIQQRRQKLTDERRSLSEQQQAVRANLAALPATKPGDEISEEAKKSRDGLLKRYLGKMTSLENSLDELSEREQKLLAEEQKAQEELHALELVPEAK